MRVGFDRTPNGSCGEYGWGCGSRNSRQNLGSRPACSAAIAAGSCLAALAMTPNMNNVIAVELPPAEINGNCKPVTGSRPTT